MTHEIGNKRTSGKLPDPHQAGLPLWSGLSILIAALITGLLLSLHFGVIAWPFLALFIASSLIVILVVNPRSLFLTASFIPILFAVFTTITGYFLVKQSAPQQSAGLNKTQLITVFYPLLQLFPYLASVTVGVVLIAGLRIAILKQRSVKTRSIAHADRVHREQSDARNRASVKKARRQLRSTTAPGSKQVTVEDLMRRRATEPRRQPRTYSPNAERRGAKRYAPNLPSPGSIRDAQDVEKRMAPRREVRAPHKENPENARRSRGFNDNLYR